jgi:short subunit dehydrogenase-like uncharacterized protein
MQCIVSVPLLMQVEYATSACARNGIHYVDITGETPWILDIIQK